MKTADLAHRRGITATHAGRTEHADLRRVRVHFEGIKQRLGSLELACDRIADADGGGRRRGLAFLHHVEMGIKGCNLVDRCLRQAHLLTQRTQNGGPKGGGSGPESDGETRSADRAGEAGSRAIRAPREARHPRSDVPWERPWRACVTQYWPPGPSLHWLRTSAPRYLFCVSRRLAAFRPTAKVRLELRSFPRSRCRRAGRPDGRLPSSFGSPALL